MRFNFFKQKELLNMVFFLTGRTISVLFSYLYTFALGLYVLKQTGSGLSFAITLSLQIIPTVVFGPFAGVLADRLNKKIIVVATDALSGFVFLLLYFVSYNGLSIPLIYLSTLLISIFQTLYNICVDAAIPEIVSKNNTIKLNSSSKVIDSISAIISSGLGGIIYSLTDIRTFILINSASFLVSSAIGCLIKFHQKSNVPDIKSKMDIKKDLMDGMKFIKETSWVKDQIITFSFFNFIISLAYTIPIPYILNSIYRLSSRNYGIVQCFIPIGMIVGALMVKTITCKIDYKKLLIINSFLASGCLFATGILPAFSKDLLPSIIVPFYGFIFICIGAVISLIDIPLINNFQTNIPEHLIGRTLSISISIIKLINPVSYILSGTLMKFLPAYWLPLCASLIFITKILLKNIDVIKQIKSISMKS